MIRINPECPDQTQVAFGFADVLCGTGIQVFGGGKKVGLCYYYNADKHNTDKKFRIGKTIDSLKTLSEIPLPNVIMTFDNTKSLDVVICGLQKIKEVMENESEKLIECDGNQMS